MKSRKKKTPSVLATRMFKQRIQFDARTDTMLTTPTTHRNKQDDLCNNNKCVNPEFKRIGFGQLPRHMMPQFPSVKVARSLVSKINKRFHLNVKGYYKQVAIRKLYPTQNEISRSRVEDILNKNPYTILTRASKPPMITSDTGSVIDGHHRSEALKLAVKQGYVNPNETVRVFVIDLPAWTILSMANKFGYNKDSHPF